MKHPGLQIILWLCGFFVFLSCTETAKIELHTAYPPYYKLFLKEVQRIDSTELREQKEKTVLFHPILSESADFKDGEAYFNHILTRIQNNDTYKKIVVLSDIRPQFDEDMAALYSKYIDTYRFSHISDREFTRQLYEVFGIDSILFFQIGAWPCATCLNKNLVEMNLTLIDAYSGAVIWLAYDENETANDRSNLTNSGHAIRQLLLNSFYLSFRKLPHMQYRKALIAKSNR